MQSCESFGSTRFTVRTCPTTARRKLPLSTDKAANMKRLAIIPARGGSKGIPGKNLAVLGGRPLLAWSIQAALSSKCLDRVVVSTDDPAIAEVALALGAEVPFLRPEDLSRDETPTFPVIRHLHEALRKSGWSADVVAVLQPTSPFRTAHDIRECLRLQQELAADVIVSMTPSEAHPAWCFSLSEAGSLVPFLAEKMANRRQALSPIFRPNGALYVLTREYLEHNTTFYNEKTRAYIMPPERSLDIDTPWDLTLARLIAEHLPMPN